MKYDPIKKILGDAVGSRPFLRKLFYLILGLLFLREWHVKRALRKMFTRHTVRALLDAGSGFGQYSYYCAKHFRGMSIHAVDVKEDQIRDCSEFFRKEGLTNVRFSVEDLTKPIHSEEFDLVLSVDVMEHIEDDLTVFQNFYRALKTGGHVLINTPSSFGGSDTDDPRDPGFVEEHARSGYEPQEMQTKLSSAGFEVEEIRFTYGRWGSIGWRLGIKIPMLILDANRALIILLLFYYLLTLPFILLLMSLDYVFENKTGTGLLVIARKM